MNSLNDLIDNRELRLSVEMIAEGQTDSLYKSLKAMNLPGYDTTCSVKS